MTAAQIDRPLTRSYYNLLSLVCAILVIAFQISLYDCFQFSGAPLSSVDIVFLLDTSNGVTQSDLRQQKEFAKLVAKQFGVAPSFSHAAVFSYSDKPILISGFFDYRMGKNFEDIVDSVTLTGGRRNIQEALQRTQSLLTSARPDVPRVVFLITYGQQARELGSQRLREIAKSVKDMRAVLYIIGVGVDENDPQLQQVVERRSDFFEIPSSGDLNSYVQPIAYYAVSRTGKPITIMRINLLKVGPKRHSCWNNW